MKESTTKRVAGNQWSYETSERLSGEKDGK